MQVSCRGDWRRRHSLATRPLRLWRAVLVHCMKGRPNLKPTPHPAFRKRRTFCALRYLGETGVARVIAPPYRSESSNLAPSSDWGCRAAADVGPDPASQELTTATASISIMKSGPARRVTPTVVLVGVATPR
jgi:hypothetical protein